MCSISVQFKIISAKTFFGYVAFGFQSNWMQLKTHLHLLFCQGHRNLSNEKPCTWLEATERTVGIFCQQKSDPEWEALIDDFPCYHKKNTCAVSTGSFRSRNTCFCPRKVSNYLCNKIRLTRFISLVMKGVTKQTKKSLPH